MREQTRIEMIDPVTAKELLELNIERNRKYSEDKVNLYSKAMMSDEFILSNDAITISSNNKLLNGQNRLRAIIRTNKSCKLMVLKGVPEDTFKIIDTSGKRTAGQIFGIEGLKNGGSISTAVHYIMSFNGDKKFMDKSKALPYILVRYYKENKEEIDHAITFLHGLKKTLPYPSCLAAFIILSRHNKRLTEEMFGKLSGKELYLSDEPVSILLDMIQDFKNKGHLLRNRESRAYIFGLLINTWNRYAKNQLNIKKKGINWYPTGTPNREPENLPEIYPL